MLSLNRRKTLIFTLILLVLSTVILLGIVTSKPDIHSITIEELQEINGLGELLSSRVVIYLDTYPNADIDDLLNVEGIGDVKLELIKKKWGD